MLLLLLLLLFRVAVDAAAAVQAVVVVVVGVRAPMLGRMREDRPAVSIGFYSTSGTRSVIHRCCRE